MQNMKNLKQLSLFVENRPGAISEVCRVLKDAHVNICAMNVADTTEFGILRMLLDDIDRGNAALKSAGFITRENNVLAIAVPDCAGGLAGVFEKTGSLGMSVEYMYAIPSAKQGKAVIIFRFDDQESAAGKLTAAGIELLTADEIRS